jgi:phospho-N-acetylmuramoyl-pentapeptide-transferase
MQELSDVVLIIAYSGLSFLIAFIVAPWYIGKLRKYNIGKNIRTEASGGGKAEIFAQMHAKKAGTPTMGGLLIIGTVLLMILLSRILSYYGWIDHSLLNRKETYIPVFTLISAAILGGVDDWFNLKGLWKKGIPMLPKMIMMTILAIAGAWWFTSKLGFDSINIPGLGELFLGNWYILLFVFIFTAAGNSVNFTDGLDGLAGGLLVMSFSFFAALAFHQGMFLLATFCGVIVGATTAFLWYNINPAQFFMGDVGSLSLGCTLGVIALLTDNIVPFIFIAGVYIIETLSVIIQLTSKKLRNGKKVFYVAPIHHHFEKVGWPETMVVMRFWIIGGILGMLGLIIGMMS